MAKMLLKSLFFFINILLFSAIFIFYNSCTLFSKHHHQVKPNTVQLSQERLNIYVSKNREVKVEVNYIFKGNMQAGFKLGFPENDTVIYNNFQYFAENKQLPVKKEFPPHGRLLDFGVGLYQAAYTCEIPTLMQGTFRHNILYSYKMPLYFEPGSKNEESPGYYVEYILKTGSLWQGNIDKLEVFVHLENIPCKAVRVPREALPGKCINEHLWFSKLTEQKPLKNIELIIDQSVIDS